MVGIYTNDDDLYGYTSEQCKLNIDEFVCETDVNINPSEKYIIIKGSGISHSDFLYDKSYISEKLINILQLPNVSILFYNESESEHCDIILIFDNFCKSYNINKNKIHIVTGNVKNRLLSKQSEFNFYVSEALQHFTAKDMVQHSTNKWTYDRKHIFQSNASRFKMHRYGIIGYLYLNGYENISDISFLQGMNCHLNTKWPYFSDIDSEKISKYFVDTGIKYSLYEDETISQKNFDTVDFHSVYRSKSYENSYIKIVTESQFEYQNVIHITEKTMIPFYFYQIPILLATPNHIQICKELYDFDFFDDVINHSYDSETDNKKRFRMICDELERLKSKKEYLRDFF